MKMEKKKVESIKLFFLRINRAGSFLVELSLAIAWTGKSPYFFRVISFVSSADTKSGLVLSH
jgi:hypothetical protein